MSEEKAHPHTLYLCGLFPRWKLTPELKGLVDRMWKYTHLLGGDEDEQVHAALDQHRKDRKGNDPDLNVVSQRIANLVAQKTYRAPRVVHAPATTEGELHSLGYWFRHYAKPENRRKLDAQVLASLEYHETNKTARAKLTRVCKEIAA